VESGGPSVQKVGECDVKSRHLQGCSPPPTSVKDRWVGPCEQVLNVLTAYRRYGPDKPSSLLLTDVWLSSLLLWLRVGEKLDGDP
jgi:hypothetical protein